MKSLQVKSLLKLFELLPNDEQLEFLSSIDLEKLSKGSVKAIINENNNKYVSEIANMDPKDTDLKQKLLTLIQYDKAIAEYIIQKDYVYDAMSQMLSFTRHTKFFALYEYHSVYIDEGLQYNLILTDFDPMFEPNKLQFYRDVPNNRYHFYKYELNWLPFSFDNPQFLQFSKDYQIGPHDWMVLNQNGEYEEM